MPWHSSPRRLKSISSSSDRALRAASWPSSCRWPASRWSSSSRAAGASTAREHEYTKDEWLNGNPSLEDRLMSDPTRQRNTFRRNDKEKAIPGTHTYGCVVGGGTVTYGGSSWRHLPWEFNEASTVGTIAGTVWRTGRSPTRSSSRTTRRPSGRWGSRASASISPFVAPMSKDYPVPPMPLKASGALFKIGAAKLG